jgi:hypothetical protein
MIFSIEPPWGKFNYLLFLSFLKHHKGDHQNFLLKKRVNIIQFLFTLRKVCLISCLRQTKVLNWIVKQCLRFNLFDNLKGETFCSSIKNPKWSHFPLQPPKPTMIQIIVQFLSLKIGDLQPFPPQGSL